MSDDIQRVAKSRADHLGGETARRSMDNRGVARGRTGDSRTAGPPDGTGTASGVEGMPRSDLNLGDESTGGRAAEQAVGALPEESGREIPDRTQR